MLKIFIKPKNNVTLKEMWNFVLDNGFNLTINERGTIVRVPKLFIKKLNILADCEVINGN